MIKSFKKFKKFQSANARSGVRPVTFQEWIVGRLSGRSILRVATLATRRGDYDTLTAALLAIWAGNQSDGSQSIHKTPPHEVSKALREGRVSIVIAPAKTEDSEFSI